MTAQKSILLATACIVSAFVSCDEIPIREMVKARTSIERAREVMAGKYDPDNLNKAVEGLDTSHTFIAEKKAGDAKKAAEQSLASAELAIRVSLPKAVDDTLADANGAYQEADKLNAEKFAPVQYALAGNTIKEADQLKADQKLYEAFKKAKLALDEATSAKEASSAKIPQLKEELGNLKKEVDDLQSHQLSDQQKQDIANAKGSLEKAEELIGKGNIKEAVPLMGQAGQSIENVRLALRKAAAIENIATLKREAAQLKKNRGSEFAGEDLDAVDADLNEAESNVQKEDLDEAEKKMADAENSLAAAKNKTLKGLAADKSKSVEKLIDEAKKKDTQKRYAAEIAKAEGMDADAKKLMDAGSYKDSIAKFSEAECLLNSLAIAGEKKQLSQTGGAVNPEGGRFYTVVFDKKKRDCLWRIAGKLYRNAKLWPLIYVANKDQIKDPDLIFPGQKFVIPEIPKRGEPMPKGEEGVNEAKGPEGSMPIMKEEKTEKTPEGTTE